VKDCERLAHELLKEQVKIARDDKFTREFDKLAYDIVVGSSGVVTKVPASLNDRGYEALMSDNGAWSTFDKYFTAMLMTAHVDPLKNQYRILVARRGN